MSELTGGDLFSLWPDHFLSKPVPGLDWSLKDQQIVPVPIVLLDDGRVAFQSEDGQICLLDGLQGVGEGEDVFLPLPSFMDPATELPALSDATIKSMLVHHDLDSELPRVDSRVPEPIKELSPSPVDDDLKALVSFRCQNCSFSSADVPSLMHHFDTEHAQIDTDTVIEDSSGSIEAMDSSPSPDVEETVGSESVEELTVNVVEQFIYLCSECKEGFRSVSRCRDHMIKDHNMVFDDVEKEEHIDVEGDEEVISLDVPAAEPQLPTPPSNTLVPNVPKKIPIKPPKSTSKLREYDPEFEAKPHKCREGSCVHKFRSLSSLEAHMECHTGDSPHLCCSQCSMLFLRWNQCAEHLWKVHGVDVDLYTCNICNEYRTTTRNKLESHSKIHNEERPYLCGECGKGFKQRTQLVNHTVSVHNKNKANAPKWYMSQKCEICFKTYADSKCLKKHMQAVHSKLKPYSCQICGHMSARKAMMQAHVRQHTGEKPFACKLCAFKTGDHNSLRRHVMRHTGKRPYNCPHCPYTCIQSCSLKSHLRLRHPGQSGVFTCNQCYFVTVNQDSFQKHLSDHKLNLIPPSDVEVFPENVAAAHLVYRSFGASPSRLHCDVTASSTSRDGMKQTITISIPSGESAVTDDEDTTHCFLPGDEIDTGGITIPAEPENEQLICF